ncbi:MAG: glutamate--tRNA ligase family protein [Sulfurimonadaceae bacterium]|nr:glutamate--tRNA ligase family protein [Sulfurimonadaceae bacterium]
MVVSRIAPTPSGYLHLGNAVNFLLTSWYVRNQGGTLILRIDDMDATRCRSEFLDDVFFALEWLQIDIDEGPSGTDEFYRNYSMVDKMDYYRDELYKLKEKNGLLYACECSRKTIEQYASNGIYPQLCRNSAYNLETHRSAMRIHVPDDTVISIGDRKICLDKEIGDFVLWRKDGLAAYQFVSVIEDRDLGVNTLIRGEDLLVSSAAQLYLAPMMQADRFANATFIHHPLLMGEGNKKLSKSEGAYALKQMRESHLAKEKVFKEARKLAQILDIEVPAR